MHNLVFMGTSPFAARILEAFEHQSDNINLVGIVTQPAKPAGRGRKLMPSAVEQTALAKFPSTPLLTTTKLKTELLDWLTKLKAEVLLVAAYGRILPKLVLDAMPKNAINVHASDLPRWRGAAPVQFTLMSGAKQICNSYILMDEGMDTGPVLKKSKFINCRNKTTAELLQQLADIAADDIIDVINGWCTQDLLAQDQLESQASLTHLLTNKHGELDFSLPASVLYRAILALSEHPGCWYKNRQSDQSIRVHDASICNDESHNVQAGTILGFDKKGLKVACGKQTLLNIDRLQRPGGKAIHSSQAANASHFFGQVGDSILGSVKPMPDILYQP